jgi:hypothetical protein
VVSNEYGLSSLETTSLSCSLNGVDIIQYSRTYPGNYSINFANCFSEIEDFKTKNYTDFYLTKNSKFSDLFKIDESTPTCEGIYTTLKFGNEYLKAVSIDFEPYKELNRIREALNYRACIIGSLEENESYFDIIFLENNYCNIIFYDKNERFYLVSDSDNTVFFISERNLSIENDTNSPHSFKYVLDDKYNHIFLSQIKQNGNYYITKSGSKLKLELITPNNKDIILNSKILISRNKNIRVYPNLNTNFVKYKNSDNTIDKDFGDSNLTNNFLLHRKSQNLNSELDLIVLKNQVLQNDVFSSSNNLISASNSGYVNNLREYTSIFEDIRCEESQDLILNYVFYNKPIKIKSGYTEFTTPSSMYPFERLNINDSKIIESGAFAFDSPLYSDKIYKLDLNNRSKSSQSYLCTWLSGSPDNSNKIWIDRYYYPDLISKQDALTSKPIFAETYNGYIESLIQSNLNLKSSIDERKFFDKISDLTFEPNQKYRYKRISPEDFNFVSPTITKANNFSLNYPNNYFKSINKSGKFTVAFNFEGDDNEWIFYSDKNNINSGLRITKTSNTLTISYTIFDNSKNSYTTNSITENYKKYKLNFVAVSVDSLNGIGYFYLNNKTIEKLKYPIGQFSVKNLLYGDFFVDSNSTKIDSLQSIITKNLFISDEYVTDQIVNTISIFNNLTSIDELYISIPCGLRNSFDNISLLQSICGVTASKSNNINVKVKNTNIENSEILKQLELVIREDIKHYLPVSNRIINIDFENYK